MIDIHQATEIVLANKISLSEVAAPLSETVNCVLNEDIVADRDFPPFDRVTMDGIAILFEVFENGHRKFPIEKIGAAGAPRTRLVNPLHCIEVMTGAVLPENTDTVVRYEDLLIRDGVATTENESIRWKQNVHFQGEDRKKGEVIVKSGRKLTAAETGVAATVGLSTLKTLAAPKVAILSNGDEIVDIDTIPLPHQIRRSNSVSIEGLLSGWGIAANNEHLPDNEEYILSRLEYLLNSYDAIIVSGGVSKGKYDFLPAAFENTGVEKLFHKVAQRPGKPFWFGRHPGGCVVFAFPGNPVSAFMCTMRYFLPWLKACLNLSLKTPHAVLTEDFEFKKTLTYFLQVKIDFTTDGVITATPVPGHGSGDLANLVETDGFLELPATENLFRKGDAFPFYSYRKLL